MSPEASLKFAVVREDPSIELELLARHRCVRPLVVASGGCTALALAQCDIERVTAFDLNPRQLAHVDEKRRAVEAGDLAALNVEHDAPGALNQRGAFEGLFRVLRRFVEEFVASPEELASTLDPKTPEEKRAAAVARIFASSYWPAAFATTFNDPFLHAMFGPAATQHAESGSYPGYFRRAFERGLLRADGAQNPFLHHVFLGRYLADHAPAYVRGGFRAPLSLVEGTLLDVPDLARFDLFSLSNVFDWSDDALVASWAERLETEARPGSVIVMRQLNNRRDLRAFFGDAFRFDDALGEALQARDRSLFYERIEVGVRA